MVTEHLRKGVNVDRDAGEGALSAMSELAQIVLDKSIGKDGEAPSFKWDDLNVQSEACSRLRVELIIKGLRPTAAYSTMLSYKVDKNKYNDLAQGDVREDLVIIKSEYGADGSPGIQYTFGINTVRILRGAYKTYEIGKPEELLDARLNDPDYELLGRLFTAAREQEAQKAIRTISKK